jgi:hypothetical protein|tara:strand:+ start:1607 stop:1963 length:357 start_codon:yes stop_codon:yes gene_type:complete
MKVWNKCICLTSKCSLRVILILTCIVSILAFTYSNSSEEEVFTKEVKESWIPTQEDINYQDSMYSVIEQTQLEVDTIKFSIENIIHKLDRLYYDEDSWDSIKYVKGGEIDRALTKKKS